MFCGPSPKTISPQLTAEHFFGSLGQSDVFIERVNHGHQMGN
jgi:hypothetical protein